MIGYGNVAKGANRILALERGERSDDDLLANIAVALRLDSLHVHELAEADRSAREQAWQEWANEPVAPQLRVRVIPAVWYRVPLADGLSRDGAVSFATARAIEK